MSSGANYFFGFLITFVVLLLIFVACGIGSRRFFYSRRTLFVNDVTDWATQTTQPTFWEAWLKEGGPNWNTMAVSTKKTNQNSLPILFFFFLSFQPLSASLVRRKNEDLETPPPQRHHPFVTFFSKPSRQTDAPQPVDEEPPDDLQLAVMISMPSSHDREQQEKRPMEYEIGVTRVPWRDKLES